MADTKTTARKRKITVQKMTQSKTVAPTKTANKPKAERPTVPMHHIKSDYPGVSTVENQRVSKTDIDYTKFGTLPNAKMTDRDIKSLAALRAEFGGRQFPRANVDAGILKRLGERGFIEHVAGGSSDPLATFKLTAKKAA